MAAPELERVLVRPLPGIESLLARPVTGFAQDRLDQPIEVLPSPTVTLMFQIGAPLEETPAAFIAGPRLSALSVTGAGSVACVDVKLSPLGAARLFGPILGEVAGRIVDLGDVLPGHAAEQLLEQVALAPDWPSRLARIQGFLYDAGRDAHPVAERVVEAWSRLSAPVPAPRISEVAGASGWSQRHFAQLFRRYTGLTPKSAARLLRVQRTMEALRSQTPMPLAEVAVRNGYADQAHMSRELVEFTGRSPDRFRRNPRLVPVGTLRSAVEAPRRAPPR